MCEQVSYVWIHGHTDLLPSSLDLTCVLGIHTYILYVFYVYGGTGSSRLVQTNTLVIINLQLFGEEEENISSKV